MIHYVFAMQREADLFWRLAEGKVPKGETDVIGINAVDKKTYDDDAILMNVGYAGGYKVKVGSIIEPLYAVNAYTRDIKRIDSLFHVERKLCFTSDAFVTAPMVDYSVIYDMELFKIAEKPYKKLYSLKIVSDNLDETDCEKFNEADPWNRAIDLIAEYLKGKE
jgi:hypothetical protein